MRACIVFNTIPPVKYCATRSLKSYHTRLSSRCKHLFRLKSFKIECGKHGLFSENFLYIYELLTIFGIVKYSE